MGLRSVTTSANVDVFLLVFPVTSGEGTHSPVSPAAGLVLNIHLIQRYCDSNVYGNFVEGYNRN